jgi:hypothetical protein
LCYRLRRILDLKIYFLTDEIKIYNIKVGQNTFFYEPIITGKLDEEDKELFDDWRDSNSASIEEMHSSIAGPKFEYVNNIEFDHSSGKFPDFQHSELIDNHGQEISDEFEEEIISNSEEDQVSSSTQENTQISFKGRTQRIGAVSKHLGRRDFNIKKILRSNNKALKLYILRLVKKYRDETKINLNRASNRFLLFDFIRDHFRSEYRVKKRDIYNLLAVCFHFYLGETKSQTFFKYYLILTILDLYKEESLAVNQKRLH